ncbi:unnamed protein product [Moneuplotes crassus]|uniref:Ubiquitin carboxyl-terminal hydrolase n=1 Tax=Euplotes crassus TaxID=5936 RepID=A0AAD1XTE9_EUPCR|nr:unnamed protein product [Moneuplotes crassus]
MGCQATNLHKEERKSKKNSGDYHWPALESNPEIFTKYLRAIGMEEEWQVCEIFGMDDDCLGFVPKPCLGVIVTFERNGSNIDDGRPGDGDSSDLVEFYMKQNQKLDNACGIIACLHTVLNHTQDVEIMKGSILDKFWKEVEDQNPKQRANYLENFDEFQKEHKKYASKGQTQAPTSSKQVKHHFVAFILNKEDQLIELDGTKTGPALILEDCKDLLKGVSSELQRRIKNKNITESLSMMAFTKTP